MARQIKKLPGVTPDPDFTPEGMAELPLPIPQAAGPDSQPAPAHIAALLERLEMAVLALRLAPAKPPTEVMDTLARLEGALGALADIIQGPRPVTLAPEALDQLTRELREGLSKGLSAELATTQDTGRRSLQEAHSAAEKEIHEYVKAIEKWMEQLANYTGWRLRQVTNGAVRKVEEAATAITGGEAISQLMTATSVLKGSSASMSTMVSAVETFLDELDYVSPAVLQNAEHRLRRVALHAGLISSAVTVVGIALTSIMLRKMGIVL